MKRFDMYKCDTCDVVLDVVTGAECLDELSGFKKLEEKTADASLEKHVPFIVETETGYTVKVGKEVFHPMTAEHSIKMIEIIIDGDKLYRAYLNPGDEPVAHFEVKKGETVIAREYCNLHGLWRS